MYAVIIYALFVSVSNLACIIQMVTHVCLTHGEDSEVGMFVIVITGCSFRLWLNGILITGADFTTFRSSFLERAILKMFVNLTGKQP